MRPYHHFRYLMAGDIDRTLRLASLFGSVALAFICTAPAYAATQIFLTWPGILGPSQVIGHVGDIPLTSYSQNASNNGGVSVCGQVTFTKQIDSTSPLFLGMVLKGTTSPQATVTFASQNGGTETTYYTVDLRNVIPTSITQSDSAGDVITEQIVLSARAFRFTYTTQLPNGGMSAKAAAFAESSHSSSFRI
jgi:type VI protein secretion system component Hcp